MTDIEEAVARVEDSLPEPLSSHARFITAALSYYDNKPAEHDVLLAWHTILAALERAERERDEASDGIARWMIRMSKIREAAGVGSKPMLEELPGEIAAILTRAQSAEAALAALKAEVVEVERRAVNVEAALATLSKAAWRVICARDAFRTPQRLSHPNLVLEEAEAWIALRACFDADTPSSDTATDTGRNT